MWYLKLSPKHRLQKVFKIAAIFTRLYLLELQNRILGEQKASLPFKSYLPVQKALRPDLIILFCVTFLVAGEVAELLPRSWLGRP